ncbi:M48 family metalloprotease [Romeria aff. gracilis LEGE 07310]|uniref:M48 family metalloprotease n=1 Tax=Vasconcelosia minhoensis LEGE 07310 TaxID=915328 RepID=A0A8J7DBE2_9CYAN|nr:M48 family metalloprotease [Romeria gracilis]MBE9077617.1 M48 family metalloprotease [Romeria aff. gracilis LEGE 07310]
MPETDPEQLLQAGLSALKQRAYEQAMTALTTLSQAEVPPSYQVKARMGQIQVRAAQADWAAAIALCEPLLRSKNSALQGWAKAMRSRLAQQTTTVPDSGFQPLPVAAMTPPPANSPTSPLDQSGFVPLSPAASPPAAIRPADPPLVSAPSSPSAIAETAAAPADSPPSLFHYEALNQNAARLDNDPLAVSADIHHWRSAGRLEKGRRLGEGCKFWLWVAQLATPLLTFGLLRWLLHHFLALVNGYLGMMGRILPIGIGPISALSRDLTWPLVALLVAMLVILPWLWERLLGLTVGLKPLAPRQLSASSAEALALLRKQCLQRRWPFPSLKCLPTDLPLIFSYGSLPRTARLVVSQGLLDQLQPDEIAALCAYEISHWRRWDWTVLSWHGLIAQGFHQLYWSLALQSNRQPRMVKLATGVLANVSYGLFWLVQKSGLWVARRRTYESDRAAVVLTGNPNGLTRALAKLSFGLAQGVARQGYTPPWVESLDLLLPVSGSPSRQALYGQVPLADLFAWDCQNPYRSWLSLNNSHPPLGDRLQLLMAIARHWRLEPELDLPARPKHRALSAQQWRTLLAQGAPYFGLLIGLGAALLLWSLGAFADAIGWAFLDWLYHDLSLIKSALLLGLGIGILLRINRFFPDLPPAQPPTDDALPTWINAPQQLPLDSSAANISGRLLGRPGAANWLGQDLLLQTAHGLLKLHFFSAWGSIGNSLGNAPKPIEYLGQTVQVRGWFRRGCLIWLDVSQIQTAPGRFIPAQAPIWSALILAAACGSGLWILVRGSA